MTTCATAKVRSSHMLHPLQPDDPDVYPHTLDTPWSVAESAVQVCGPNGMVLQSTCTSELPTKVVL